MHWEWVYLPASSYAIFSSCFLSTNQPHSACLNTGGLRISKKMQFRGLRTTRSWITSRHSKTWIRAKYSSWHISIQESQENFVPNTGTKPLRQIFLAVRSHRPLNNWTWGTSRRAEIQQQFRKSVVQETSLCTFVLRSLHTCSEILSLTFVKLHIHIISYLSTYLIACAPLRTSIDPYIDPIPTMHLNHWVEGVLELHFDRQGAKVPKRLEWEWRLEVFPMLVESRVNENPNAKKKTALQCGKAGKKGAKNIATFVN